VDEGGAGLSAEGGAGTWARAARHRAAAPTRLGLALRSLLTAPRDGYAAVLRTVERRARAGERPAEGYAPYVLAVIGGAAAMALWLKLGAIVGRTTSGRLTADVGLLVAALVLGSLLALAAQFAWGPAGSAAAAHLGHGAPRRDLRVVWGDCGLPQTFMLAILVPLDLLIAGPAAFASAAPPDPVARAWVALSLAIAVALAGWSTWLFVRGVQVATGLPLRRSLAVALVGPLTAAAVIAAVIVVGRIALPLVS
jgi:hypothetical protein